MLFQLTNVAICHWFFEHVEVCLAVWHSSIPFACNYPANLFELSAAAVTNSNRMAKGSEGESAGVCGKASTNSLYLCTKLKCDAFLY